MGALCFISWAVRERPPPVPTKLFLELPEDVNEEVRRCFESLGVEMCVRPDVPTSVAASPPAEPRGKEVNWRAAARSDIRVVCPYAQELFESKRQRRGNVSGSSSNETW
ncbi:unnamed protein product [Prorocentrum cordatum]|uniref:Uncharacterized protein n=1 Tax=Prorocentrum cordatum TaxID=2364126 RepID=A0ABN9QGQ4_9DINO|nr:unnamed protein product [Polarella glacialis]